MLNATIALEALHGDFAVDMDSLAQFAACAAMELLLVQNTPKYALNEPAGRQNASLYQRSGCQS
jgi:hypothetical protein